jgi:hypothetical protein
MAAMLTLSERLLEGVLAVAETVETAEERLRHLRLQTVDIEQRVGVTVVSRSGGFLGLFATEVEQGVADLTAALHFVRDPFASPEPEEGDEEPTPPPPPPPDKEPLTRGELRELQDLIAAQRLGHDAPTLRGRWNSQWQRVAQRVFERAGWEGELPAYPDRRMLERAREWWG